ncbi:phospholipase D-like domain-containing protein [uncultured Jatrophihabitans sp.]|uniref:phospholipase D-like domain-containing protein n=1 Tax=uncultured Jatrophihabitans sp. TaxID=1610747 RepID=UPI0035CB05CD
MSRPPSDDTVGLAAPDDLDAALRYFPSPTPECPTFVEDTSWEPLLDGARYLPALSELLDAAGPGDAVSVVGLELDPALDLHGREPGDAGYDPLGDRLARLAAAGVEVRILVAARTWASSLPGTFFGGFRATAEHAAAMRALRPDPGAPPPLRGRVLLDHSGGALLGSNHQKAVVVRIGGELVALVSGIDLVRHRYDAGPHDTQQLDGRRWGWHDIAVRLRGRAAEQVWTALRLRWIEASTLPRRYRVNAAGRVVALNPEPAVPPADATATTEPVPTPGTAVRVVRSAYRDKLATALPWRRIPWRVQPVGGYQEIFATLTHAISQARRYVYLEDQYLSESAGGDHDYELWPVLRAAAGRGVRVVLVGSGDRDPEDVGVHLGPINRTMNPDIRRKLVEPLDRLHCNNVAEFRVEHVTVHAKLVLVDDVFASIGSANMFSRSMVGTDCELCAAVSTTTTLVRDLRVAVWGEHLRAPLEPVRAQLEDLDLALGMWRPEWATGGDPLLWRAPGHPSGFAPAERALRLVGP